MNEIWAEIAGIPVTVGYAAGAAAALTLLVFFLLHRAAYRGAARGSWLDGLGFGLLPAAAVWKIFEMQCAPAGGRTAPEPLDRIPWIVPDGGWFPARAELALAALAFAGVCLWLILRKKDELPAGETLLTSLCLWSGIRVVTECLRAEPSRILMYGYEAGVLICLLVWTVKRIRRGGGRKRSAADWIAVLLCAAMIAVTAEGILSVGSAVGDLAVIAGCAVLEVLLTLLCGSDERKADPPVQADPGDTIVMKPV